MKILSIKESTILTYKIELDDADKEQLIENKAFGGYSFLVLMGVTTYAFKNIERKISEFLGFKISLKPTTENKDHCYVTRIIDPFLKEVLKEEE